MEISDETLSDRLSPYSCLHGAFRLAPTSAATMLSRRPGLHAPSHHNSSSTVACCAIVHPTHRVLASCPHIHTVAAAPVAIDVMSRTFCRQIADVLRRTASFRASLAIPTYCIIMTNQESAGPPCLLSRQPCNARHALHVLFISSPSGPVQNSHNAWHILLVTRIFRSLA